MLCRHLECVGVAGGDERCFDSTRKMGCVSQCHFLAPSDLRLSEIARPTHFTMLEFVVSLLCVLSAPDDFSAAETHLLESRPQRFQRATQPA